MIESIRAKQQVSNNAASQISKSEETQTKTKQPIFKHKDNTQTVAIEKLSDGSTKVTKQDGTQEITKPDGTKIITNEKNKYKKTINKDGSSVEEADKKIIHRDKNNKITQIETEEDGKEIHIKFEYAGKKTITRRYEVTDKTETLTRIAIAEQKDGHKYSSIYKSEEDMKNNKLSERIIDIGNPTTMKTEKYSYDENGNIKIVTTDSSGNSTTKYTNSKGKEIPETDFKEPPTEETTSENEKNTHTVAKGETIQQMVTDALKAQGIDTPTEDQLKAAKKAFLEENKDLVHTYNGSKKEWHGNKFFLIDSVVTFPDFTKIIQEAKTSTEKPTPAEDKKFTEKERANIQKELGDKYVVELDQNKKIVVKDKQGNVLPEITKMANDNSSDEDDINKMMSMDKNNNKKLELAEYSKFIHNMLDKAELKLEGEDAVKAEKLIHESFKALDTDNNNGIDRVELRAKARGVIQKLTEDISKI